MATKKPVIKSAAVLTWFGASEWDAKGRASIIKWMRKQIGFLQKYHKKPGFSKRFTARYLYKER